MTNYLIEKIKSPHFYNGRAGFKPSLIVLHICDGTYEGTKGWFANPNSQVSSNYIVGKNGQICEAVPLVNAAWCNGTSSNSSSSTFYGNSTNNIVKANGSNANYYSVSIECEGYYDKTKGALTGKQLDALVWLIKRIQADVKALCGVDIPSNRKHIIGHYEVNPKIRPCCPGEKFPWDLLMAKLNGTGNGNGSTSTGSTSGSSTAKISKGDIVQFLGGNVYAASNAPQASATREASRCKVTSTFDGMHPYHLISEDGKMVYGWVDAVKVKKL